MKYFYCLLFFSILNVSCLFSQRLSIDLNENWNFRFSHQVERTTRRVDLPHTWNTVDALVGKRDYKRGVGNYYKTVFIKNEWKGKRLFIRFKGANTVTNLLLNGKHIGEHRGGYGAFIFELTDFVKYGENNKLWVRVNNAEQLDIMPLVGDFNMYGGIYRGVELIVTDQLCISPLDYASPGVYLHQESVSKDNSKISAEVLLSSSKLNTSADVCVKVLDGKKIVLNENKEIKINNKDERIFIPLEIKNPRLWNGRKDPFMYEVLVELKVNDKVIDSVKQPLGLRYYCTDPQKGFFLNGEYLKLKGVCRHQDRAEVGNALHYSHHEEDVQIMLNMGANAVRLAHYPQATEVYDLMDKHGIVVWAEIPFVGPGGYDDKGFIDQKSFKENGKEQLRELIRQHYNHPSICFWGIFNELKEQGDNPISYIKELNALAHEEDSTRPTTAASNQSGDINFLTDNIAWNRYDGWYGGDPNSLAVFLDKTHAAHPEIKIGISEYGAGASIYHQQDSLKKVSPNSWWHPENWQTYYHRKNWEIISERPFVWGSFIWNLFDFGAAHRTEGDRPGINDKGLVTFDRKVFKDSYFYYKANWNKEDPMVYIAEKRNNRRKSGTQNIMVFTTQKEVELWINGESYGRKEADKYSTVLWENVKLVDGNNLIKVVDVKNKKLYDSCEIIVVNN